MPAAYPMELRERVVRAYEENEVWSYRRVGEVFDLGEATVKRWVHRSRRGELQPKTPGGDVRPRVIDDVGLAYLKWVLDELPDSTLRELQQAYLERFQVEVHISTIHVYVTKRLGYSLKRGTSSRRNAIGRT